MQSNDGDAPKRKDSDFTQYSTSSRMKRFLNSLKPNQMFYTRDCLDFGTRGAVDKFLARLVDTGVLIRVARGNFMLNLPGVKIPPVHEIAAGKAKAFGRRIFTHGVNCLKEFLVFDHAPTARSYATDGATSSFGSIRGRIHLKCYAPRKLTLGDTNEGKLIRGLWHFKNPQFAYAVWEILREFLRRTERNALRNTGRIIPTWLVDICKYNIPRRETMPSELEELVASMRVRFDRPPTPL